MEDPIYLAGLKIANEMVGEIHEMNSAQWIVPRSMRSKKSRVTVTFGRAKKHCTCRDFGGEDRWCRHLYAVEIVRQRNNGHDDSADLKRLGREIAEWKEPELNPPDTWYVVERPYSSRVEPLIYNEGGFCVCECADFCGTKQEEWCHHIWAVHFTLAKRRKQAAQRPFIADPFLDLSIPKPAASKWSLYNQSRRNEKKDFRRLLQGLCRNLSDPPSARGRPRHPLSDVVFATALKVYEKKDSRGNESDVKNAFRERWISTAPMRTSVEGFLGKPANTALLNSLIASAARPLLGVDTHYACDSSGFTVSRRSHWNDEKTGKRKHGSDWHMVQLICGVQTYAVASAKVVGRSAKDPKHLIDMVHRAKENFVVDTVSADKGYLSRRNYTGVSDLGVKLFTPFKSNSKADGDEFWQRAYHTFHAHPEKFAEVYNKRQSAESAFWMIKAKFDEKVHSKKSPAPENEILVKVLCHNICCVLRAMHLFGLDPDFHL